MTHDAPYLSRGAKGQSPPVFTSQTGVKMFPQEGTERYREKLKELSYETLYEFLKQYPEKSIPQLAGELGVTNQAAYSWAKRFKITTYPKIRPGKYSGYRFRGNISQNAPGDDFYCRDYKFFLELAKKNGFNNVTFFLHELYAQWGSCRCVGKYLKMSADGVKTLLKKACVKLNGKGGNHAPMRVCHNDDQYWGSPCLNGHGSREGKTLRNKDGHCVEYRRISYLTKTGCIDREGLLNH